MTVPSPAHRGPALRGPNMGIGKQEPTALRTNGSKGIPNPRTASGPPSLVGGNILTVHISNLKVSNDPKDVLVTYALGSCIAVVIHDPVRVAGGMIHFMLPRSGVSPAKAVANPAMYADTGVPLLFRRMYELGSAREDLVVKVVGGGNLYDPEGTYNIGERNYGALREVFEKHGIPIAAEDVGGSESRTARLHVGTGIVVVRSRGREVEL
ncbi:MAG: chemotaxis protein CheD [Candidatus Eisenbacteria bacterium]